MNLKGSIIELKQSEERLVILSKEEEETVEETVEDEETGELGDKDKEIVIEGVSYRIQEVTSPTRLTLTEDYKGQTNANASYYIGPRLIGEPWELRIPTSLVYLQQEDEPLPDFTQ